MKLSSPRMILLLFLTLTNVATIADEWRWARVEWTGTGVASIACPPDTSHVIYVTPSNATADCIEPGVYKSSDSGVTWRFLEESYNPHCHIVTAHPMDQATVYCGIPAQWIEPIYWPMRSRDAGAHWEEIRENTDRITASPAVPGLLFGTVKYNQWWISRSTDDGVTWEGLAGLDGPGLSDNVVFDHGDPTVVFACMVQDTIGLARSTDDGATWEMVLEGRIEGFDQDPHDSVHWATVISTGQNFPAYFVESFDGGKNWKRRELPDGIDGLRQVLFDLHDSKIIYLVGAWRGLVNLGVYRSNDGGYTWATMNDSLPRPSGTSEVFRLKDPPGELLAARSDGLWRWTDRVSAEEPEGVRPRTLRLSKLGPCPFSRSLRGRMTLSAEGYVIAGTYSLEGRLVRRLMAGRLGPGDHVLLWDGLDEGGRETPPGLYILSVQVDGERVAKQAVKIR